MNGYCPQCSFVNKEKISMKINSSDYFECPNCNLQILNSEVNNIAVIIPVRGNGKGYKDYSSEAWLKGYLLSKAKIDDSVIKPELIFFQTPDELKEYLKTIE